MKLIGANASAAVTGTEELPGKSNYFIGNDPKKWRTNVPNFAQVRYQDVYPGVDLVYYGAQGGQLEYDFVVAPGADAHSIGLSFQGPGRIHVDKRTGDLVLALDDSELRFRKPVVYQPTSGSGLPTDRHAIDGRFVLTGRNQIGFQVAAYDRRAPLIIDPVLIYSTYLGGGKVNFGIRVAVDASGSACVTGITNSSDFPTTAGVFSSMLHPGINCTFYGKSFPCPDAFVTKLNPAGTELVYSAYLGGSGADGATGISVDSSGNAYVTGATGSIDFPTTQGAFQRTASPGRAHAFATKLNAAGSGLIYSTYLGGSRDDGSTISALDSGGNLYVAGLTTSTDFPTTPGVVQNGLAAGSCGHSYEPRPCADGFIAKLNPQGSALVYSTYLGGSNDDAILGLAVDSGGDAYVTGATFSTNFPTKSPLQSTVSTATCGTSQGGTPLPCSHAFVTKLNSIGTALAYSTYLGGNENDAGFGIAVDATGAAYVTGATNSTQFSTTTGAVQPSFGGGSCGNPAYPFNCPDAFVAKVEPSGTALAYSTYLGGSSFDFGMGIAVDNSGNAYVVGGTDSLDFPTDPTQGNFQGGSCSTGAYVLGRPLSFSFDCPNAFLTEIDPTGSTRLFSTYLGGVSGDVAFGVAADASGGTYVAGSTLSSDFPVSGGALQLSMSGYVDAFITKFGSSPGVNLSPSALAFAAQVVGTGSASQQITLTNTGTSSLTITDVATTTDFGETGNCVGTVAASGSCTINVTFTPMAAGSLTGTLTITDNNNGVAGSTQIVALSGTGQDFTLSASSGSSTSATVAPGSPATYTLSLGGEGGFSQSVSLTCTGAPSEATCTVPNPVTARSSATNVTVSVTTTAPSVSVPGSRPLPPAPPLSPGLRALLMLALVLAAMAWAIVRRNQLRVSRWQSTTVPVAAGLLLTLALAGCGGGGGGGGGGTTSNPGTPAGTYSLTVTGTAGSGSSALSHSVTLTLTVS